MNFFVSIREIISSLEAPFSFIEASSETNSKSTGSASPIMNASKKSENGAGFVTPQPPAITIGSPSFLSDVNAGTLPSSSMARTSVIPSSYPMEKPIMSVLLSGIPVSRV